jgi:circadian clock protein KaiB
MTSSQDEILDRSDDAPALAHGNRYQLTLFVSGASDLSARAIADARHLCDVHLDGRYQLTVVDVHAEHAKLVHTSVLVTPTLVKEAPLPSRQIVGDLSDTDKVLLALELRVPPGAAKSVG